MSQDLKPNKYPECLRIGAMAFNCAACAGMLWLAYITACAILDSNIIKLHNNPADLFHQIRDNILLPLWIFGAFFCLSCIIYSFTVGRALRSILGKGVVQADQGDANPETPVNNGTNS